MIEIKRFLEKFLGKRYSLDLIEKSVVEVVLKETGLGNSKMNISIKGSIVFISANPVVKNLVFLSKEKILSEISRTVDGWNITDIR